MSPHLESVGASTTVSRPEATGPSRSASRFLVETRRRDDIAIVEPRRSFSQTKAKPVQHLAARMAAKEAVVKSLRSAWPCPLHGDDYATATAVCLFDGGG